MYGYLRNAKETEVFKECKLYLEENIDKFSKFDKKDLEKSMEIANKIMKSENKDEIIKNLKNNLN